MKKIFMIFLVILFSMSLYGQLDCDPTVNGQFVNQQLDLQSMTYSVKVQINITDNNGESVKMKYCKAKFTYNDNDIEFVSGEVLTFTQGYESSVYLDDDYIVVKFDKEGNQNYISVGENYVDLVELHFDILDANGYSNICLKKNKSIFKDKYDDVLGIGVWLCDEHPLPVELTQFIVNTVNSVVTLNWTTATEINNKGFDIERNYNNGYWYKVGYVEGNGNSYIPVHYSYIDNPTLSGTYQYRLKQIDFNGTINYSDVVETNITVDKYSLGQNFPNPFNPSTTIRYEIKDAGQVQLRVYDILGNEVSVLVDDYQNVGIHYVKLDASNLASGLYIYKLIVNENVFVKKMTLLK